MIFVGKKSHIHLDASIFFYKGCHTVLHGLSLVASVFFSFKSGHALVDKLNNKIKMSRGSTKTKERTNQEGDKEMQKRGA
jgi:hypothetical protein